LEGVGDGVKDNLEEIKVLIALEITKDIVEQSLMFSISFT